MWRTVFLMASAALCAMLAILGGELFQWTQRLTRRLGLDRLADARARLAAVHLVAVARALLAVLAILLVTLVVKQALSETP